MDFVLLLRGELATTSLLDQKRGCASLNPLQDTLSFSLRFCEAFNSVAVEIITSNRAYGKSGSRVD